MNIELAAEKGASSWLTSLPVKEFGYIQWRNVGRWRPRLLAKRRPHMEPARFAHGKVTGRCGHSANLVRILLLVDMVDMT